MFCDGLGCQAPFRSCTEAGGFRPAQVRPQRRQGGQGESLRRPLVVQTHAPVQRLLHHRMAGHWPGPAGNTPRIGRQRALKRGKLYIVPSVSVAKVRRRLLFLGGVLTGRVCLLRRFAANCCLWSFGEDGGRATYDEGFRACGCSAPASRPSGGCVDAPIRPHL